MIAPVNKRAVKPIKKPAASPEPRFIRQLKAWIRTEKGRQALQAAAVRAEAATRKLAEDFAIRPEDLELPFTAVKQS